MERDFLGAIGRNGSKVEPGKAESDYLGGAPPMQWQVPAKAGAAPGFMSFRSAREEGSKEAVSDHFSLSGFQAPASAGDAPDGIRKQAPPAMHHQQRQFGFDGQVSPQQYAAAVHAHRAQGMDSYGVAAQHLMGGSRIVHAVASRHPVPFNQGNPMHRVQSLPSVTGGSPLKNQCFAPGNSVSGSVVGMYGARDPRNPKSTQMTIFYDGSVTVFDNIPVEKVQELMVLASRASTASPPSTVRKSDSPISATAKFPVSEVLPARQITVQKPEPSVAHGPGISTPVPVKSQAAPLRMRTSSPNNDSSRPKSAVVPSVVPPISQASSSLPVPVATTDASAITSRAVPQARKASLARFLEKRKERVSSVVPYPCSKSPLESSDTVGSPSAPSQSSCADTVPSSNNEEEFLSLGHQRNISFSSGNFPSTKLHM